MHAVLSPGRSVLEEVGEAGESVGAWSVSFAGVLGSVRA